MDNFFTEMAEILEVEEIADDAVLDDFDTWDSLSILSVVAMADSSFGVQVTAQEVRSVDTVQALHALILCRHTPN